MNKRLSYLIESELEKAEVVLAAKSITDAIQKMAETAAKMEADDLMPLNDPVREHFGPEAAAAFSEGVATKLRELVKIISDTKNSISDEIARMQGELSGTPQNDLATMDDDGAGDGAAGAGESDLDMELPDPSEIETGEGEGEGEEAPAPEAPVEAPKFDDAALGSTKAAGRARKESVEHRKPMLETANPDRAIAKKYVGMIREGKSATDAAHAITESYGLTVGDLIEIVASYKK